MFGSQSGGSKTICQFHLRGQCKHGSRCWNIHQDRGTGPGAVFGGSSATPGLFSGFDKNTSSVQDKPFFEFIKQVGVEMNSWEKNGMWLLSSLAPLKDHPILAGFSDTSPEELRVEAYEALKKNDPNSYQANVKEKLEFHKNLRQSLRNQTPEAIAALRAVFYKNGDTANVNAFGKTPSAVTSLFGKSSSDQPSLFGGNAINQPSNAFASINTNQSASIFGNSANSNKSTSIFGGSSNLGSNQTSSLFGASNSSNGQNQSNLFGTSSNSNIPNQSNSLFGGISNSSGSTQSSNHFGASENATGSNTSTSLFGGSGNMTGSTGLFGTKPQSNAFGGSPVFSSINSNGTSTFKASPGESIFGGQSNTVFGSNSTGEQGTSLFGNNSQSNSTNASLFNNSQSVFTGSSQSPLTNSLFGSQGNPSTSLFGNLSNASSNSGAFGSSALAQGTQSFVGGGDQSQKTLLFTPTQPVSTPNLIGRESQASTFGNNSTQGASNLFGNNILKDQAIENLIQGASNVFRTNNISNQATGNLTQGASNVFGSNNINNQATGIPDQGSSNVFGSNINSQVTTNLSSNNTSAFGGLLSQSASATNHVASLNSGTLFGKNFNAAQPANTLFGGSVTATSAIQKPIQFSANSASHFSSGNPPMLNNCSESSNKVYTPLHLLSEEDRTEFERDVFLKIPLVPPPKELCVG